MKEVQNTGINAALSWAFKTLIENQYSDYNGICDDCGYYCNCKECGQDSFDKHKKTCSFVKNLRELAEVLTRLNVDGIEKDLAKVITEE